jgi:hypothetical protein
MAQFHFSISGSSTEKVLKIFGFMRARKIVGNVGQKFWFR